MIFKKSSMSHILAVLAALVVIVLDQWSKNLVVEHLGPPDSGRSFSLIGEYLTLYYIQNRGSAMGLLTNPVLLTVFIAIALVVLVIFYVRTLHNALTSYKILFGVILGGAAGNIIDRFARGGSVVDFIFFRIPPIGFKFYIFNIADAAISIAIALLLIFAFFGEMHKKSEIDVTHNLHG